MGGKAAAATAWDQTRPVALLHAQLDVSHAARHELLRFLGGSQHTLSVASLVAALGRGVRDWALFTVGVSKRTFRPPSFRLPFSALHSRPVRLALAALVYTLRFARLCLSPEVLARQLVLVCALVWWRWGVRRVASGLKLLGKQGRWERTVRRQMASAQTYAEYAMLGRELDKARQLRGGNDGLRDEELRTLRNKISLYRKLLLAHDLPLLCFHLRSELLRKHWGLGRQDHVTTSHPKVKRLLEVHMDVVCAALGLIAGSSDLPSHEVVPRSHSDPDTPSLVTPPHQQPASDEQHHALAPQEAYHPLAPRMATSPLFARLPTAPNPPGDSSAPDALLDKLAFFQETRHAFGRSALLLSGGAAMGIQHIGVVKALHTNRLLPRVLSGASAGSIVAAFVGCATEEELPLLWTSGKLPIKFFGHQSDAPPPTTRAGRRDSGWRARCEEWVTHAREMVLLLPPPLDMLLGNVLPRIAQERPLFDWQVLRDTIRNVIGDMTFAEAYDRSGRIINITVTPHQGGDWPRLLNYLTAPHVVVWSAVVASCALPGVFGPVELLARTPSGHIKTFEHNAVQWSDGSIENDLPMERLSELFNINHFIVSQVNPHAQLLATGCDDGTLSARSLTFLKSQLRAYVKDLAGVVLGSVPFRPLGLGLVPVLTQRYEGDITILADFLPSDLVKLFRNPTNRDFDDFVRRGERNAWAHIERIRLHCNIEFMLDDCVFALKRQVASQGDGAQLSVNFGRLPSFLNVQALANEREQQQQQQGCGRGNEQQGLRRLAVQPAGSNSGLRLRVRSIHGLASLMSEGARNGAQ